MVTLEIKDNEGCILYLEVSAKGGEDIEISASYRMRYGHTYVRKYKGVDQFSKDILRTANGALIWAIVKQTMDVPQNVG